MLGTARRLDAAELQLLLDRPAQAHQHLGDERLRIGVIPREEELRRSVADGGDLPAAQTACDFTTWSRQAAIAGPAFGYIDLRRGRRAARAGQLRGLQHPTASLPLTTVTRMLDDDELGAYIALVAAGDLMQRSVAEQLAEHQLSTLQFSILATLLAHPGGLRMHDLADRMVISRSGLTYQVTQLEARGFVSRAAASDDDRGVEVRLIEPGRERVQGAFPGHVDLVRGVFLDVIEPGQIAPLRSTLERVVEKLRARPRAEAAASAAEARLHLGRRGQRAASTEALGRDRAGGGCPGHGIRKVRGRSPGRRPARR